MLSSHSTPNVSRHSVQSHSILCFAGFLVGTKNPENRKCCSAVLNTTAVKIKNKNHTYRGQWTTKQILCSAILFCECVIAMLLTDAKFRHHRRGSWRTIVSMAFYYRFDAVDVFTVRETKIWHNEKIKTFRMKIYHVPLSGLDTASVQTAHYKLYNCRYLIIL